MSVMKPFVKWFGGKRRILKQFEDRVPKNYNRYFEPFLGGGVLFLNLMPHKAILNDFNGDLIDTWEIIKNHPQKLFVQLDKLKKEYSEIKDKRSFYNSQCELYNDLLTNKNYKGNLKDLVFKCALFIFLNKTGFNGLYRVNPTGKFNVPWNQASKLSLYEKENINQISQFLRNNQIDFYQQDFIQVLQKAKKNDFIYLDPPYYLLSKNGFVGYTKHKFLKKQQIDLAHVFKELNQKGCFVMLSNHQTQEVNELYSDFNIQIIPTKRTMNCKGDKRGFVAEVLITNYQTKNKYDKDFQSFLSVSRIPEWYTDFSKVQNQSQKYKEQADKLDKIMHLPNFKSHLLQLVQTDFQVLKLIVLLFAVRWDKFQMKKDWCSTSSSIISSDEWEHIFTFLEKVGIIQFLTSGKIHNCFDYLFGVGIGLDSNARKNRTGKIMEERVGKVLKQKLKEKRITWYEKQKTVADVVSKYSLNLPSFSEIVQKKRFDFIYQKETVVYLLECNYYNASGSKIVATITHHQKLYEEIKKMAVDYEFVWVTDGLYWNNEKLWASAEHKIKNLFLLKDFEKN